MSRKKEGLFNDALALVVIFIVAIACCYLVGDSISVVMKQYHAEDRR